MRIAITGVTGFIGRRLATTALEHGHEVVGFSRRPWTGAPYIPLDHRHFLELPARPDPAALAGVGAIVHLAIAPQSAPDAVIDAVNRLGTEHMLEAARGAGIGRFVFVSSQSAHAEVESAYARSKHASEQLLAGQAGVVVVRPGMVYGDGNDGLMGRATRAAARVHAFPVIGGRAARVQPIEVNELCEALVALATMDDPPSFVMLADPTVGQLSDFVRDEAKRQYGVTPRALPVPLGVARAAVRLATRLHLPSPISEANINGIAAFSPMDTAADVSRMHEVVRAAAVPATSTPPEPVEPRRLVLVGAGRIGLVHALTAAHHQGMVLAGIVDLDRGAMQRLVALAGPSIPTFTDLDEALRILKPEAAIIGTPPSSHVPLARKLLAAGVDVLVEKPIAATSADRRALAAAIAEHPDRHLSTGYLAGVLPHLDAIASDLRAGRFGEPRSFEAHAFVSRVEAGVAEQRDMWELDPNISGGGALVNLGVHILAMLDVLLGPVEATAATLVASGGRVAEDGAALELRAGGIPGRFATAWHLGGFDMPENNLRIDTDRGYVVCTTSCAAFVGDTDVHMVHQVDADTGFDLAPMDAGGAFWAEQDLLGSRTVGANSLARADRVEELITRVYETASRISPPTPAATEKPPMWPPLDPGVLPDLRGAPSGTRRVDGALAGTDAFGESAPAIVALPDAPGHFRTLTNAGAVTLARELGFGNLARAALGVSPRHAASSGGRAWEALLALLRAELARVPRGYAGALVVDAYLVDLATATGNQRVIAAALEDLRSARPRAQVGIEVNAAARLVAHLPALASQLDLVVALGTMRRSSLEQVRELLPSSVEVVVKTGVLPRELLDIAWNEPERWTHGAGRLVVHWPGSPALREVHDAALSEAKRAAGLDAARPVLD